MRHAGHLVRRVKQRLGAHVVIDAEPHPHGDRFMVERDRFINPGEDFTPEPEVVAPAAGATNAL